LKASTFLEEKMITDNMTRIIIIRREKNLDDVQGVCINKSVKERENSVKQNGVPS
jgi:shikimate kinase